MSDFCKELDQRLREQEPYSSKDSIIINNPPYNPRGDEKLISNTMNFFKTFLNIELEGASFKACQLLPGKKTTALWFNACCNSEICILCRKKSGIQSTETPQGEEKSSERKKYLYQ